LRISYLGAGAADAPAVVLLHALGDQGKAWEPVLDSLAAEYRVFAPDLSGHGQSDWPGSYAFENYSDDVLGFLDVLELDRVVLVGHSMGGVIAYLLAMREPDRVDRLVVEDVAPPRRRDRPIPDRPEEPLDFDWDVATAIIGQVNRGEPDVWAGLADISAPTLLIGGGTESHIPQQQFEEVRDLIPVCELITLPTGHYVHRSLPERFGQAALDWLSTRPGT
jgi:pimeloyl-ACP methyl ester carboxylesterase